MFNEEKFKTAATIVRQNSFYDDFAILYATEFFNWMTDYISHLHAISSVIWYLMIFLKLIRHCQIIIKNDPNYDI